MIASQLERIEQARRTCRAMKRGQVIGLVIAGICALGAFLLMKGMVSKPSPQAQVDVRSNTVEVLVAKLDMGLGHITSEASFRWQAWPQDAVPIGAITNRAEANATASLAQHVARTPMLAGEPITRAKLVKPGDGGVLAAILPAGKRAMSTKITEDSAVGRLILPNDHVDVILIKREKGRGGKEELSRDMILSNVRILAIGQRFETKDGQKAADGNTATFELTPAQAEKLAMGKNQGELTLMLRSIADLKTEDIQAEERRVRSSDAVRMTRFGIRKAY